MAGTVGQGEPGEKRREIPYLGAVKIAAVVMGIMIVVGIAVIGVTISKRLAGAGADKSEPAQGHAAPSGFSDRDINLPAGSTLRQTLLDGRRLALRLRLADGSDAILLVDAETGARLGMIRLPIETP